MVLYHYFFLFLMIGMPFCYAENSPMAQRDEQCKELLYKATFAELEYKKRLSLYEETLPLITFGVSEEVKDNFMTALAGLMKVHEAGATEKNRLLELLLHRAQRIATLDTRREQITSWLTTLAKENEADALKTTDLVALYIPSLSGYLRVVQDGPMPRWQAGPMPEGAVFPHPSIVCSLEKTTGDSNILTTNTTYRLVPKYVQRGTLAAPVEGLSLSIQLKKSDLEPRNVHDADRVQLSITEIGGNRALQDVWGKIERISPDNLTNMENKHFADQLASLKIEGTPEESLGKIKNLVVLFNDRVASQHKEVVMQELRSLIAKRHRFKPETVRALRELCASAATAMSSGAERQECKRFVALLNKDVESQVLKFGDVVMVKTSDQKTLWSALQPLREQEGSADLMMTSQHDPRATKGANLMQVVSSAGRSGMIRYGDDIELRPLYGTNGARLVALEDHLRLSVCKKEHRGATINYMACRPTHDATQQANAVLTLTPPKSLETFTKMGAAYAPGDPAYLVHKPSQKMLCYGNEGTPATGCQLKSEGDAFLLSKPSPAQMQEVSGTFVAQELAGALNLKTYSEKLSRLHNLTATIKAGLPDTAQKKVWSVIQQLHDQREGMSVDEVQQHANFSRAVLPSLTCMSDTQRGLFTTEMNFYERLRVADGKNGAERLAAYQALVPYITAQTVPEQYKNRFLQQLKGLYDRKSREFGSLQELMELVVTATQETEKHEASL